MDLKKVLTQEEEEEDSWSTLIPPTSLAPSMPIQHIA